MKKRILQLFMVWCLPSAFAVAADLRFIWNHDTPQLVSSYQLHWGVESGKYTQLLDVGNQLRGTVSGLDPKTVYCFAATAKDAHGRQSAYSNEVCSAPVLGNCLELKIQVEHANITVGGNP